MDKFILNCFDGDKLHKDYKMPIKSFNELRSASSLKDFSRRHLNSKIRNQGSLGSCVGMSGVSVLEDTHFDTELSPYFLYSVAQRYDEWEGENYSGTSISGACKALRNQGCSKEIYCRYPKEEKAYIDSQAFIDAKNQTIKGYFRVEANKTSEIKNLLKTNGLWTSILLHDKFYDISHNGVIPSYGYLKSAVAGGHAVSLIGWKTIEDKLYWEFKNSWGKYWGDDGYFFMEDSIFRSTIIGGIYYLETNSQKVDDLKELKNSQGKWYNKIKMLLQSTISSIIYYSMKLINIFNKGQ